MNAPRSWFPQWKKPARVARVENRKYRSKARRGLSLEPLEDRRMMSVVPNDPEFPNQWPLHNTGQTGGLYDADIDMPAAWSITTGSMATIVAILDSGVDYTHPDLYLNMWLNQGEIPPIIAASLMDTDGDTLFTFRDLNGAANAAHVTDVNGNGYIDGGDLLNDARWENGIDEDGNGKVDDLIGWDTHDNDNDPAPSEDHGTRMCVSIGAVGNNSLGTAGVNWAVRMMPVRVQFLSDNRNNANAAAGLDYAVSLGASISFNRRDNIYSQEVFDAMERARAAGHLCMAGSGNLSQDIDATPFYPASYNLDNILVVAAVDASEELTSQSCWGLQSVDLAAPSHTSAVSPALGNATGVAVLLKSLHPDWDYAQLKARLMATVEPIPSLAGKSVTGGRLNAAHALATTSISISDPSITEGNSGTTQLVFSLTRFGDSTGSVTLNWSTASGTAIAGSDFVAASGQVTFTPSGPNSHTIAISITGDTGPESDETFFVGLGVVSGDALLADENAQGKILNDDLTKFYVVNDATTNLTYEYGANGAAIENYSLNSGNAAPRGAASVAAGDKVWVVDNNRTVYVYNPSGGLLGSWAAGSMNASATPTGIATNGTDVWIVDSKSDKVFKYTGAASLLSGSQNAASNFALNTSNKDASDIVTDGTHLWVVNNSSTDKVFKYTLAGALAGSWTISTAGVLSPTGITLDPSNPSHLWIVDAGTDRVYQYDNAVGNTSGFQAASTSFALAAGNTNPQGIADPPVRQASSLSDSTWKSEPRAADAVFGSDLDQDEDQALAEFSSDNHNRALLTVLAEFDFAESRGKQRRLPWAMELAALGS